MAFRPDVVDLAARGLREAQRGALHAVAAHYACSDEPAQVVLPTGVGKTLVAMLLPYILGTPRVLVVTPARIIRDQVAHQFATLEVARDVGAVSVDTPPPSLMRADHRCNAKAWETAREHEVVVGTPQVLSHAYHGVSPIPDRLFDLVIFDEAHHLPAPTWTTLHAHLKEVPAVLLTATPFRADRRRLPGEIAFAYPLRRAIAAGAYKPVKYVPVAAVPGTSRDQTLAETVARRLRSAEHVAAKSRALVRTDRQAHARELVQVYEKAGLGVAVVLDNTAGRTVRKYLTRLQADNDLDGLVVVGAMTEGFDFPRMKLAAYHRPHRTLAPTLQFIGRLARAGGVQGELVAFAEDVSEETSALFREEAVWETMLPDLVDTAVDRERRVREFSSGLTTIATALHEVSALAIAPPRSTHIFRLQAPPDLRFNPQQIADGTVIERFRHAQHQLLAFVTRRRLHPRFMRDDALDSVEHHLHVATWVENPGVLFISTDIASAVRQLVDGLTNGRATPVAADDLTRLLAAADLERCFSVGARSTNVGTAANESYRTLAGPRAELSLTPSDARVRVLGHVMGRMKGTGAGSGTFGFSSKKAKLWEPTPTDSLFDFREWCVGHANILGSGLQPGGGNAALNYLSLPDRLRAFPDAPAIAVLPAEILMDTREMRLNGTMAEPLAVATVCMRQSPTDVRLTLTHENDVCELNVTVDGTTTTVLGTARLIDRTTGEVEDLEDVLYEHPATLLFGDGTWVFGQQILRPPAQFDPLPPEARTPIDWSAVNMSHEFVEPLAAATSVAGKTVDLLWNTADWVIQDHRKDELADFITLRQTGDQVEVNLVHCKKPGGAPGTRVTDIQEVLAQAMRSMYLATAGSEIWLALTDRVQNRPYTKVLKGTKEAVLGQLALWSANQPLIQWSITCVQPGVDDTQLATWTQGNALMSAAYDACKAQGVAFRLFDALP
ncbi:MAG: DEAD/DEAH box helicase [Solirubrobacterales bacterium]